MKLKAHDWRQFYKRLPLWEESAVLDLLYDRDPRAAVAAGKDAARREEDRRTAKQHLDAAIDLDELKVEWKVDPVVGRVLSHPKVRKALEAVNPDVARQLRDEAMARRLYGSSYAIRPSILAQWVARSEAFPLFGFTPDDFARPDDSATATLARAMPLEESDSEVQRREHLLSAYKTATGCRDADIYNAAGLPHKTDFYKWRKGKLSRQSATARTLEQFLEAMKPPTAKKPKPASRRRSAAGGS